MQSDKFRIATLGLEGTFSHQASIEVKTFLERTVMDTSIQFSPTIGKLFDSLGKDCELIVAPIENSEAGSVISCVDQLARKSQNDLRIVLDLDLRIDHFLAGFGRLDTITTVYSHPQSYAQCEKFFETHLSNAEVVLTTSNSKSATLLSDSISRSEAAIVPEIAATIFSLPIIRANIQNSTNNITRFVGLIKDQTLANLFDSNTKKKLSIIIDPQANYSGLLYEILGVFAERNINLSRIESRPSKRKLGDYVFHIDIEGDVSSSDTTECLDLLEEKFTVQNLGSYCNLGESRV